MTTLVCFGCDSAFIDAGLFLIHILNYSNRCDLIHGGEVEDLKCWHCENKFKDSADLLGHIELSDCLKSSIDYEPNGEKLQQLRMKSASPKTSDLQVFHSCSDNKCEYTSFDYENIRLHVTSCHHSENFIRCDICVEASFPDISNKNQHLKEHHKQYLLANNVKIDERGRTQCQKIEKNRQVGFPNV